jgi:hypothetical protein
MIRKKIMTKTNREKETIGLVPGIRRVRDGERSLPGDKITWKIIPRVISYFFLGF